MCPTFIGTWPNRDVGTAVGFNWSITKAEKGDMRGDLKKSYKYGIGWSIGR